MAFYFLSRYEEYQDFKADSFGRFGFENALESQWNYDPAPHVDIAFFHFFMCDPSRTPVAQGRYYC
jgi:hypothetical protein